MGSEGCAPGARGRRDGRRGERTWHRTRLDVVEFVRGRRGLGGVPGTGGGLCECVNKLIKEEYNETESKVSAVICRAASFSKLFIVIIAIHGGRWGCRLGMPSIESSNGPQT